MSYRTARISSIWFIVALVVACGGDTTIDAPADTGATDTGDIRSDVDQSDGGVDARADVIGDASQTDADAGGTVVVNPCGGTDRLTLDGVETTPGSECLCGGRVVCNGPDDLLCVGGQPQNECGGCGSLPASVGTSCDACGGVWVCNEEGDVTCTGTLNLCGGCNELEGRPGDVCDSADGVGIWACEGTDDVFCVGDGRNACGGFSLLPTTPGLPCGSCNGGTTICEGRDDVFCVNPDRRVNACGGCDSLPADAGATCGCGGEWDCDPEQPGRLVCVGQSTNGCGGCEALEAPPGSECQDGRWFCAEPDLVACGVPETNACGGDAPLRLPPGQRCGGCGAGTVQCVTENATACVGDPGTNACGGCGNVDSIPGTACGTGATWQCQVDGRLSCQFGARVNACGGLTPQPGALGQPCAPCGVWACNGSEVVCREFAGAEECPFEPFEVCDDSVDNDGDGLTDCDDDECLTAAACSSLEERFRFLNVTERDDVSAQILLRDEVVWTAPLPPGELVPSPDEGGFVELAAGFYEIRVSHGEYDQRFEELLMPGEAGTMFVRGAAGGVAATEAIFVPLPERASDESVRRVQLSTAMTGRFVTRLDLNSETILGSASVEAPSVIDIPSSHPTFVSLTDPFTSVELARIDPTRIPLGGRHQLIAEDSDGEPSVLLLTENGATIETAISAEARFISLVSSSPVSVVDVERGENLLDVLEPEVLSDVVDLGTRTLIDVQVNSSTGEPITIAGTLVSFPGETPVIVFADPSRPPISALVPEADDLNDRFGVVNASPFNPVLGLQEVDSFGRESDLPSVTALAGRDATLVEIGAEDWYATSVEWLGDAVGRLELPPDPTRNGALLVAVGDSPEELRMLKVPDVAGPLDLVPLDQTQRYFVATGDLGTNGFDDFGDPEQDDEIIVYSTIRTNQTLFEWNASEMYLRSGPDFIGLGFDYLPDDSTISTGLPMTNSFGTTKVFFVTDGSLSTASRPDVEGFYAPVLNESEVPEGSVPVSFAVTEDAPAESYDISLTTTEEVISVVVPRGEQSEVVFVSPGVALNLGVAPTGGDFVLPFPTTDQFVSGASYVVVVDPNISVFVGQFFAFGDDGSLVTFVSD